MRIPINSLNILLSFVFINLLYYLLSRMYRLLKQRVKRRLVKTSQLAVAHEESHQLNLQIEEEVVTVERPRRDDWFSRLAWARYFRKLEAGGGSANERWCWQRYCHWMPRLLRYVDTEGGRNDALPTWLEWSLRLYYNNHARAFLLYVLLVLSSHVWLAPLGLSTAIGADRMTYVDLHFLSRLLATDEPASLSLEHCFSPKVMNDTLEDYCFLGGDTLISLTPISLGTHEKPSREKTDMLILSDVNNSLYYRLSLLNRSSAVLFSEDALFTLLETLRAEDERVCMCPVFFGILDNCHFYYETHLQQWRLLLSPQIYRNNSFSDQILSNVQYRAESPFYSGNRNLLASLPPEERGDALHYESFTIVYEKALVSTPNETLLHELAQHVSQRRRNRYSDEERSLDLIFYRQRILPAETPMETNSASQRRLQLTGEEAICFVHCQRLNKIMQD